MFLYLAADDALAIHEAVGRFWARRWGQVEGATISQIGAGPTVGFAVMMLAVLAYGRSGLRPRVSVVFGIGLIGPGFFGVGVDGVHGLEVVSDRHWLDVGVRLMEEGEKMLVASILVWFALMVLRDTRIRSGSERAPAAVGHR